MVQVLLPCCQVAGLALAGPIVYLVQRSAGVEHIPQVRAPSQSIQEAGVPIPILPPFKPIGIVPSNDPMCRNSQEWTKL